MLHHFRLSHPENLLHKCHVAKTFDRASIQNLEEIAGFLDS